jgi:hypothetical protein
MKSAIITLTLLLTICNNSDAQKMLADEKYGKTLNIGAGIGYYGYVGHAIPVGIINYEFDVAPNFTLAPFIGMYSYQNYYYWGSPNYAYRDYSYRETVVPIGVKGAYYFDRLFRANSNWDFYAAVSLGFKIRNVVWEGNYYGNKKDYQHTNALYVDAHAGAEYHLNERTGLFLDLSTGISSFGLAIHF